VYNNSTNFIDPSGNIPIAFLVPVAVKALTTIVGGVSFLLSLQPSQNQKNSVSPFINEFEPKFLALIKSLLAHEVYIDQYR